MRNKKVFIVLIFLLDLLHLSLKAQTSTLTSGGEASGSAGAASYSMGQTLYTTLFGATGTASQGVQQPFEIMVLTGIENKTISLECSVYPNPTHDFLRLRIDNAAADQLSFMLYDLNGKQLLCKNIEGKESTISMQNFIQATYFLKIIDRNKEIKTFKIIKK
jgi:hypothetical protein